jgi:hypothetical protein
MPVKKRRAKPKQPKPSRPHAPGYGFPKGTKGLLPWSWAEQRLKKSHNYWITTVKSDGSPHTMGRLGRLARRALPVQHWRQVAKGAQPRA